MTETAMSPGRRLLADLGVNMKILAAITVAVAVAVVVGLAGLAELGKPARRPS